VPCGHNVTFVGSGPDAIEAARQQQFDVAFIDVAMSPMDGLSTLSRLKAVSPDTQCIMITAFYSGELSRRVRSNIVSDAMQLGARGCLRKPFELDTIARAAEYFGRQSANFSRATSEAQSADAAYTGGQS
jgi:CheY-like chemotaxis protein